MKQVETLSEILQVSEGKFPKPIKLSPRITIWEEEKVSTWMKEKL
ncbi:AlpA family phage regulatory protein [Aliarcobacter butzleri]|nr:AlpA family phage regulatory protein [Aliarcobacter butzleri]